jgi:hypothetical protein
MSVFLCIKKSLACAFVSFLTTFRTITLDDKKSLSPEQADDQLLAYLLHDEQWL